MSGADSPGRDAWRDAARRALKGADVEALARPTVDGLPIQPLYGPEAADNALAPGRPDGAGWDIRGEVGEGDPAQANSHVLEALEGGCASVLLRIDPTGEAGCAVGSAEALARALQGVALEAATVAVDAGLAGPATARWLGALAKDAPAARLALHLDPLGAFALTGSSPGPIGGHVEAAAQAAAALAPAYPAASLFLASGRAAHEAGGSAAQELAMAAAAAVAYARALTAAGMSRQGAFERLVLGVAADGDVLVSIAKLRAARLMWANIANACAVDAPAVIEARSSRRMLTARDPWSNLIRLTTAGFAAAVGGADAIVLAPFTDAIGPPTKRARRLARNTQLILLDEAMLGRAADPAAGAWAFEALSLELAREAWRLFQAIEAGGGLAAALSSGLIAREVESVRRSRAEAMAADEIGIVGVNLFPDPIPAPAQVEAASPPSGAELDVRLAGADSRCAPLTPLRLAAQAEQVLADLDP